MRPRVDALPDVIHAPRTDAIYNCHSYLTKVPITAIAPFIEAFTDEGELVVDMFAGSGMTGVAATMLGRAAVLSDISTLARHIGRGYLARVDAIALRRAAADAIASARAALGDLYRTTRIGDGAEVELVRTIWSFVYACPSCAHEFVYLDHFDGDGRPPSGCPACGTGFVRRTLERVRDVPVRVVVIGPDGKHVEQPVRAGDLDRIARAAEDPRQARVPSQRIAADREMFVRCGLGRAGIVETKQFFSARNALALLELWEAIARTPEPAIAAKLRFAFTACLPRASRRYQWGPKRPLNAQNQTYYVAPVHYEWNVLELFERKLEAVLRADAMLHASAPARADYHLASADALAHLADGTVDYVFCDPPFGSNIFYSDMSLFHEAWLGELTDSAKEAVMHTSGPRRIGAAARYEQLLVGAFTEAFRVLRPGRFMSVVFGNSSGAIWVLVQEALRRAGFLAPCHVAILDKGQRSVKGQASGFEGVVTLDLVVTVRKPDGGTERADGVHPPAQLTQLLGAGLSSLDEVRAKNPSYVYAAILREAIRREQSLDGLHYGELLAMLRAGGWTLDARTGLLDRPVTPSWP